MVPREEQELKKRSLETESQVVAVLLTTMFWLLGISLVLLFPSSPSKEAVVHSYQSIALSVVALEGGAPSPEPLAGVAASQASSPAPSEAPAPMPFPALAEGASSVQAELQPVAQASSTAPPLVEKALPQQPAAPPVESAVSQAPSSLPDRSVDLDSLDEAEWEALFAEKGGRSYNNAPSRSSVSSSTTASQLSGVAASAGSGNEGAGGMASSAQSKAASSQILSQDTAVALDQIAVAAEGGQGSGFAEANQSDSTGTGAAAVLATLGTDINLVGGGSRRLLEPQEPIIIISAQNQALVKGSTEVTITFDITPEGLVLPGSIKITPEALVHGQVQAEIKSQLEKWRFQAAKGSGQVRFKYNIIKK